VRHYLDKFISGGIDWFWRKRSPGVIVLGLIVPVLIVLLSASWALSVIIPSADGAFQFSIDTTQGPPKYLIVFGIFIIVIFVALGSYLLIGEHRRANKKRVIVMELRGLRDTTGNPLIDKVPDKIIGQRQQILVNIRRSDGKILDPDEALQQVTHLPISVANLEIGVDRADITYVAGGLAPVPFSFLMGVQLDDENHIVLMDWDRNRNDWRSLDGSDDGSRFVTTGADKIGGAEEIVLSVSVSYPTNSTAIAHTFAGQPVISMSLPVFDTDGHWSEAKQVAIAQDFFSLVRTLCNTNVRRINLILAAPNSVVIRFGRIYDKRNLPAVTVWQYENGETPAYPWGISMPVAGNKTEVIRR
jgi:hypothetical protein